MRASALALLSSVFEIALAVGAGNDGSCTFGPGGCTKAEQVLSLVQVGMAKRAHTNFEAINPHYEFTPKTLCSKKHASSEKLPEDGLSSAMTACDADPVCTGVVDYACDEKQIKLCLPADPENHAGFVSGDFNGCAYIKKNAASVTTTTTTVTTLEQYDCSKLPRSMNGGSWPKGCPGAVWSDGSPSWRYCAGKDNAGNDKYPWWAACCKYDENGCTSKQD